MSLSEQNRALIERDLGLTYSDPDDAYVWLEAATKIDLNRLLDAARAEGAQPDGHLIDGKRFSLHAGDRYRHVKRGSTYTLPFGRAEAMVQCEEPISDEHTLLIYIGDDGMIFARPTREFFDGRFQPAPRQEGSAERDGGDGVPVRSLSVQATDKSARAEGVAALQQAGEPVSNHPGFPDSSIAGEPVLSLEFRPTHRHLKRGTEYEFIGPAILQTEIPLDDYNAVAVYRGPGGDLWVRSAREWQDGRFEPLPQQTALVEGVEKIIGPHEPAACGASAPSEPPRSDGEDLFPLLASAWFYGGWKAETHGERKMQSVMERAGWWPIESEAALIAKIDGGES